jgi:hypothetical protein
MKSKSDSIIKEPAWVRSKETAETQIQLPDGNIVPLETIQQSIFWPGVRLSINFGGAYRDYRSTWRKNAAAFIFKLTELVKFSWIHQETIPGSHWTAAVFRPKAFDNESVQKWLSSNIFHDYPDDPLMLLRTGSKFGVYYDTGLLISHNRVEFYLPPTKENVHFLEKTLEDLVRNELSGKIPFEYADISYGLSGWMLDFTNLRIKKNYRRMKDPEKDSCIFGSKWFLWTGDRWNTPKHYEILEIFKKNPLYKIEVRNGLQRITTDRPASHEDLKGAQSAQKLTEDLKTVIKKMITLDERLLQPIIDQELKTLNRTLKEKQGKKAKSSVLAQLKKNSLSTIIAPGQLEAGKEITAIIKKDFKKAKGALICKNIIGKRILVTLKNKLVKGQVHFVLMCNIENFKEHFNHQKPLFEQIVKTHTEMNTTVHLAPIRSKKDLEDFTAK